MPKESIDKRTKDYKDLVLRMPKNDGTITEVIDGETFKYMPEPRCRCCSADDPAKDLPNGKIVKELVDRLIMYPMSVAGILRYIDPMMEDWPTKYKITARSIRGHNKNHLPWEDVATRYMIEKWAAQKGISVLDAGERMILTEEAWLEKTTQKGWERLLEGNIEPGWAETQKAFERLQGIKDQAENIYSSTYLLAQLHKIIEAVNDIMPEEYKDALEERLREEETPALDLDNDLNVLVEESYEEFDEIEEVDPLVQEIINYEEKEEEHGTR